MGEHESHLRSECLHKGLIQVDTKDVQTAYYFVATIIAAFLSKDTRTASASSWLKCCPDLSLSRALLMRFDLLRIRINAWWHGVSKAISLAALAALFLRRSSQRP